MPKVVSFGEIMLRLSPPGFERLLQSPRFSATFGGGEANVAVSLSHFGLEALTDLPGLEGLKGSGLLDNRLPPGFAVPMPSDDPALRDDEDPLEPGDLDLGLGPPPERIEE